MFDKKKGTVEAVPFFAEILFYRRAEENCPACFKQVFCAVFRGDGQKRKMVHIFWDFAGKD